MIFKMNIFLIIVCIFVSNYLGFCVIENWIEQIMKHLSVKIMMGLYIQQVLWKRSSTWEDGLGYLIYRG